MMLTYYPDKNPLTKAVVFRMAKVKLKPGANDLTDAEIAKIKAHPDYSKYVDCGAFVENEVKETKEVEKPVSRGRKKPVPTSPLLLDSPEG